MLTDISSNFLKTTNEILVVLIGCVLRSLCYNIHNIE